LRELCNNKNEYTDFKEDINYSIIAEEIKRLPSLAYWKKLYFLAKASNF
jgi:hypothetical protein